MSPLTLITLTLTLTLVLTLTLTTTVSSATEPLTAHTELSTYGFPPGLLPSNITSYTLNKADGDFAINFRHVCQITLPPDNYLASYSKTVKGKIVNNQINYLDGIRVWAFFKWWYITSITLSDDDHLVFHVGLASAKYSKDNFRVSPACEGGMARDS